MKKLSMLSVFIFTLLIFAKAQGNEDPSTGVKQTTPVMMADAPGMHQHDAEHKEGACCKDKKCCHDKKTCSKECKHKKGGKDCCKKEGGACCKSEGKACCKKEGAACCKGHEEGGKSCHHEGAGKSCSGHKPE